MIILLVTPFILTAKIFMKSQRKKETLIQKTFPKKKAPKDDNTLRREALDKDMEITGKDLDVPGSELDDAQEAIGSEDEENNYYSLRDDDNVN